MFQNAMQMLCHHVYLYDEQVYILENALLQQHHKYYPQKAAPLLSTALIWKSAHRGGD